MTVSEFDSQQITLMSAKIKIFSQGSVIVYELSFDDGVTYSDPVQVHPQNVTVNQYDDDILIVRDDYDVNNTVRIFLGDFLEWLIIT